MEIYLCKASPASCVLHREPWPALGSTEPVPGLLSSLNSGGGSATLGRPHCKLVVFSFWKGGNTFAVGNYLNLSYPITPWWQDRRGLWWAERRAVNPWCAATASLPLGRGTPSSLPSLQPQAHESGLAAMLNNHYFWFTVTSPVRLLAGAAGVRARIRALLSVSPVRMFPYGAEGQPCAHLLPVPSGLWILTGRPQNTVTVLETAIPASVA